MSARSFGSLFMVASCASAALGCYLVSLRVASERAALESVETQIVLEQRDLRTLQTEIGTRGRLSQLERWNAGAFALSAPAANQFLQGSFELAKLVEPERKAGFDAPVVLASAPAPVAPAPLDRPDESQTASPASASELLHTASFKTETREVPARAVAELPPATAMKSTDRPVTAAKPAKSKFEDRPGLAAAKSSVAKPATKSASAAPASKKSVDKPAVALAKPMTKPVRLAKVDPLAPLADKQPSKSASKPSNSKLSRDHPAGR